MPPARTPPGASDWTLTTAPLAPGRYGNVILADEHLEIQAVIQKGVRLS